MFQIFIPRKNVSRNYYILNGMWFFSSDITWRYSARTLMACRASGPEEPSISQANSGGGGTTGSVRPIGRLSRACGLAPLSPCQREYTEYGYICSGTLFCFVLPFLCVWIRCMANSASATVFAHQEHNHLGSVVSPPLPFLSLPSFARRVDASRSSS